MNLNLNSIPGRGGAEVGLRELSEKQKFLMRVQIKFRKDKEFEPILIQNYRITILIFGLTKLLVLKQLEVEQHILALLLHN